MNDQRMISKGESMTIEEKLALFSDSDKVSLRMYLLRQTSPDMENLTSREREIFTLLLTDKPPKEIASFLKVSYYTVDFHRKNLYRKLGIQSRTELFAKYLNAAV